MLALRGCVHSTRKLLHSTCPRLGPVRDPAYLGLFKPQDEETPSPEEQAAVGDDDLVKRTHLRNAFCHKIRDWARSTPPEYISRPLSRPRSHHPKQRKTHTRKVIAGNEGDKYTVDESEELDDVDESEELDDVDEGELDVVDDEDALNELDGEDGESIERDDLAAVQCGHELANDFPEEYADEKRTVTINQSDDSTVKKARRKSGPCNPVNHDCFNTNEELYYYTEKGKVKKKPIHILAPKQEIYQRLSQSGLISSKFKRPLPVLKLVKKTDAEIVKWYYYCSIELLHFFRICHNLKEVKAIVEYHIRWSAIRTLAQKYQCNPREIVKKYGRDLECQDKKGKKVRLVTRQEIKAVARGVNKQVEMIDRFRALNILDEME